MAGDVAPLTTDPWSIISDLRSFMRIVAMAKAPKVVLITGCSSGIGEATALRLAKRGWRVYATARNSSSLGKLAKAGCQTLALDVTSEASMKAAVDAMLAKEGKVDGLVNNAGYSLSGAFETLDMDAV